MLTNLFNPSHLQALCRRYGLFPSKRYGQNFLINPVKSPPGGVAVKDGQFNRVNPEPIEKMLVAAEIKKGDTVIEVGPGFGVLTFALAEKAKQVFAFEIEKKLKPYWDGVLSPPARGGAEGGRGNVEIIWGNVLMSLRGGREADEAIPSNQAKLNPTGLLRPSRLRLFGATDGRVGARNDTVYKVVANLPYQITSPVIRAFLETDNPPELMVLMVQKEVAERICAKQGDMSILSVAVQYYAKPEIIAHVPRSYFWPEPKVDSAVIKIDSRPALPAGRQQAKDNRVDSEMFFKIVKAGFANRRKLLIKNLEPVILSFRFNSSDCHSRESGNPEILKQVQDDERVDPRLRGDDRRAVADPKEKLKQIFAELGLSPNIRAQELGVEEWKALCQKISNFTVLTRVLKLKI